MSQWADFSPAWAEVSRWKDSQRPFGTTGEEGLIMEVQNHQIIYDENLKKQIHPLSTHLDLE